MSVLKEDFKVQKRLLCDSKLFHVRCITYIVNLLLPDGIEEIKHVFENVRENVRYIKHSESCQKVFSEIVQ